MSDFKEPVDVDGFLKALDSVLGQRSGLAAGRTEQGLRLAAEAYQALATEDVETIEYLWISVGIETFCTRQLFLQLRESISVTGDLRRLRHI